MIRPNSSKKNMPLTRVPISLLVFHGMQLARYVATAHPILHFPGKKGLNWNIGIYIVLRNHHQYLGSVAGKMSNSPTFQQKSPRYQKKQFIISSYFWNIYIYIFFFLFIYIHKNQSTNQKSSSITKLMVNWWFGLAVWDSRGTHR